jgi:hypothetical protein
MTYHNQKKVSIRSACFLKMNLEEKMKLKIERQSLRYFITKSVVGLLFLSSSAFAQYATKWMDIGSFQSWYSNAGCEYEEQRTLTQQDGCRWPAIYPNQDMEAAKGIWIGVKNWKDASGTTWPVKVVHFGPRFDGDASEFTPVAFTTTDKISPVQVIVDGNTSYNNPPDVDGTDPSMKEDRLIYDSVNTAIGLTMVRKIIGFSQQYHDNYIIYDYTFTNTGNVDATPASELPTQTLDSIRVFFQYRYAVCAETRYVIGSNSAGWGIGADNDTRGDGLNPPTPFFGGVVPTGDQANDIRAQYTWMGNFNSPTYGSYTFPGMPGLGVAGAPPSDNIGGPIWGRALSSGPGPAADDTMGRLGSAQFIGVATLHADKSATDTTDDTSEPTTTAYVSSDDPLNSQSSQFNSSKMEQEYALMSAGHGVGWIAGTTAWQGQRLADRVGLGGDPSQGTTGGLSVANGYGAYNLAPGQSFHIVMAEAAAGLSREACIRIGHKFKWGEITAAQKDDSVYTGRDSLFQTFRRALANYHSGYNIPSAPEPPSLFSVTSGGDKISLSWTPPQDPKVDSFKIYRAQGLYDSAYTLLYACPKTVTSYDDVTAVRGFDYYYYITSVGVAADNNGVGNTPGGVLESSRYYTQTYDPAKLLRPGVGPVKQNGAWHLDQIRVVPNPYNIAANQNTLRYVGEPNQIGFLNIPPQCTIRIFTELGQLINTIQHTNGSGDEYWNLTTSTGQIIVSGIYIAVIETTAGGVDQVTHGAIPSGLVATRKFVVIR